MFLKTPAFPSRTASVTRTALALVLLVLIVGGIAYVAQNLRRWQKVDEGQPPPPPAKTAPLLEFTNSMTNGTDTYVVAVWEKPKPADKNSKNENKEVPFFYKEFETGTSAHYDFLFHNISDRELEFGLERSSCDCATVQACVVSPEEWQRLRAQREDKPGEPLTFQTKPAWHDLHAGPRATPLALKPGEHGVVRANWESRKSAGQELNLTPVTWAQLAHPQGPRQYHQYKIPGVMTRAVRVFPQRVNVGSLAGAPVKAEFDLWSSTRETLDVKLTGSMADPLFVVDMKSLSKMECAELAKRLNDSKESKIPTRVLCGFHVTVTVYENRGGKQMDQGVFFRKLPIFLDGFAQADLPGPEIVGWAAGDIDIGGADDRGKIRFKAFDKTTGATKEVILSSSAKTTLVPYDQHPSILKVDLTKDDKNSTKERTRWKLKVTVPPNSFAGAFAEADAVVLRIVGEPERFVRIPLEGNVGGR